MREFVAWTTCITILCVAAGCTPKSPMSDSVAISKEQIGRHTFLQGMYEDGHFPKNLVDKGKQILSEEFFDADSEIESAAAECNEVQRDR